MLSSGSLGWFFTRAPGLRKGPRGTSGESQGNLREVQEGKGAPAQSVPLHLPGFPCICNSLVIFLLILRGTTGGPQGNLSGTSGEVEGRGEPQGNLRGTSGESQGNLRVAP